MSTCNTRTVCVHVISPTQQLSLRQTFSFFSEVVKKSPCSSDGKKKPGLETFFIRISTYCPPFSPFLFSCPFFCLIFYILAPTSCLYLQMKPILIIVRSPVYAMIVNATYWVFRAPLPANGDIHIAQILQTSIQIVIVYPPLPWWWNVLI